MREMEADMPLSNAQLYAEMKNEMMGAGGQRWPRSSVDDSWGETVEKYIGDDHILSW